MVDNAGGGGRPARERPLKMAERTVPAKLKTSRPPLWSSKVHGVPNKYIPGMRLDEPAQTKLVLARKDVVATGGGGGGGGGALAGRRSGALTDRNRSTGGALVPSTPLLNDKIQRVEIDLRKNLRELARREGLHETEKSILVRTFECFDYEGTGKISRDGFRKALKTLGVHVDELEVVYMFDKYGQDMRRLMPYDVFTNRLFTSQNRLLAWTEQHKGAFSGHGGRDALAFNGKFKVDKTPFASIYTPLDWDAETAERSKLPPDAKLELEYAYGYRADDAVTSPNLFYTASKEIVYFTAGVGVVFNKEAKAQRFFVGHTDDIVSLAIDPTRTIVATGQVKSKGAAPPFVCVWDANSMQQLQRLNLKKHEGDPAVTALSFSHDGSLLVCIQRDIDHHISVWHWSTATKLMEDKSLKGPAPGGIPMIFGISWNNHVRADPNKEVQKYDFCTYGVKWLSFWKLPKVVKDGSARYNRAKMQKIGTFTDLGANQPDYKVRTGTGDLPSLSHHKCAVWLPNGDCVSGTKEGEIWLWRDTQYVWHSQAHKTALSVLTLRADGTRLLSGSLNGTIIEWNVQGATPQPISRRTIAPPHADPDPRLPGIKALDCYPGSDIYVVGTTQSDIYEVDNDPEPVVVGHSDRLDAVAPNPVRPDEYATACYSGRWFVWDARQRRPTLTRSIENEQATCIAYSPSGDEIAIGLASGSWKVYNTQHLAYAKEYTPGRPSNKNSATGLPILEEQGIACVKYCPTGRTLALGSYDQLIYLYDVAPELARTEATVASRERYRRIGKCVGHSSSVTRLDWDRTGKLLQSNSTANEHLYWWGRSGTEQELRDLHLWAEGRETPPKPGEQLTEAQREYTQWDTWSSILGFPVMGIFPQGMALEKMNVVAVSRGTGGPRDPDKPARRGQVVLGSTDHGDVLAFNFPAVINRAPYHRYDGHSSFVKNVCWLGDDARVVSVGGGDRAMLQWAVKWEAAGDGFGYQPPDAAAQVTTVGAQHAAAHAKGRDAAPAAPAQLAPPPSARPPAAGNTAPATRAAQSESDEQLQKQQQEAKVARLEAQIRAMEEQQKAMQEQQRALSNELQSLKPAS